MSSLQYVHYKRCYAVPYLKGYVPGSVKICDGRHTIRHEPQAARRLHYQPVQHVSHLLCNSTRVFYLLCYCSEGSLKVTAVADALKGRGGGKYVWVVTRISFVLFLCYVLFLFSMLLYCNVSLLVT